MYNYITSLDQLGDFFTDLQLTATIGLDVETTSLDYLTAVPLLLQVCINSKIYIFDLRKLETRYIVYVLELLFSTNKIIIGHNIKYDIQIIYNNYNIFPSNVYDTMIAEILIQQGLGSLYISYAHVVKVHLGKELSKEVRKEFYDNPDVVITEDMLIYSALDVKYLEEIRQKQLIKIQESKQLSTLEIEMKLVPVTAMMEYNGVLVDAEKWNEINELVSLTREEAKQDLVEEFINKLPEDTPNALVASKLLSLEPKALYKKKIYEETTDITEIRNLIREVLNVGSHKQIHSALTNLYGFDIPDTNEDTLKTIKEKPEIIQKILHFREYNKKESSYGGNLLDKVHPLTGRIHAKFNQIGTTTGRFSSDSPNLQNIPRPVYRPDGTPINYRSCFIAEKGRKLVTIDYAQQEYRLIGAITGEKKIIEAYKAGKDLHTLTGSIVNSIPLEEVTKLQRTDAKPVNFGVFYGSTEYGLAYKLNISLEEARRIYHALMDGIPTFVTFRNIVQEKILDVGFSVTLTGRRRCFEKKTLFEGGNSERYTYINKIKREGFNHIIQGTGADITKLAMIEIFYTNPFGDKLKLLMAEHDEVVCSVEESVVAQAFEFIKKCMVDVEQPFLGEIPAEVDGVISDCWDKA